MITKSQLTLFFMVLLMTSLVLSPFLLSVSMIALAILSVVNIEVGKKHFVFEWDSEAWQRLRNWRDYKVWLVFSLHFCIVLFSFWQTEPDNWAFWWERLRLKVPFLGVPLLFIALPPFSRQQLHQLFALFSIVMAVVGLGVGINYMLDFEAITLSLKKGSAIPTPRNHIRFSLSLAAASIFSTFLYIQKMQWRSWRLSTFFLGVSIFLTLLLHVLAVRTGLLAFYMGMSVFLLSTLVQRKKYGLAIGAVVGLLTIPILAYTLVPSIKAKVGYMLHDMHMYTQGDGNLYADSGRIVSLLVGKELIQQKPLLGVGVGNLRAATRSIYESKYVEYIEHLTPHNQFIYITAGAGIVGLFIFLFACVYPLWYRQYYKIPLIQSFYTIFFLMFMLEHTIENSIGIAYYIFLCMLLLSYGRAIDIKYQAHI